MRDLKGHLNKNEQEREKHTATSQQAVIPLNSAVSRSPAILDLATTIVTPLQFQVKSHNKFLKRFESSFLSLLFL